VDGGICEAKGLHQKFEMSMVGAKGSLFHIFFLHSNLMVAGEQIQFGQILSSMQFVQQFIYNRDREFILDSNLLRAR
jgi:hypothetical protein